MKKYFIILALFLIFSFSLAQTVQVDPQLLNQLIDILQKLVQTNTQQQSSTNNFNNNESITQFLPDENREDDVIVQLNNLRITRIAENLTQDAKAVFFAVRDTGWRCMMYESEESRSSRNCPSSLRRSIISREIAIKITNDTILLLRNRQRTQSSNFQVGDKINVYGFMDKNNYGIDALIVRKITSTTTTPLTSRPSIRLLSPNGGEVWEVGKTYTIRWNTMGFPSASQVQIALLDTRYDPDESGMAIIVNTKNSGSYTWKIPSRLGSMILGDGNVYKISVVVNEGGPGKYDISDNYFSIVSATPIAPSIRVISPNGGEVWEVGKTYKIVWNFQWSPFRMSVEPKAAVNISVFDKQKGLNYGPIGIYSFMLDCPGDMKKSTKLETYTCDWTVPPVLARGIYSENLGNPNHEYKIWITVTTHFVPGAEPFYIEDYSDAPFSIVAPKSFTESSATIIGDLRRVADLRNLTSYLVVYWTKSGFFPTTSANSGNDWLGLKTAFQVVGMNMQLPKPDSGGPYEYYPCTDDNKTVNHFILRTRLEQTEAAAPNLYKESYNYSTIPVGWNCFGAQISCQASNREYCIVQ